MARAGRGIGRPRGDRRAAPGSARRRRRPPPSPRARSAAASARRPRPRAGELDHRGGPRLAQDPVRRYRPRTDTGARAASRKTTWIAKRMPNVWTLRQRGISSPSPARSARSSASPSRRERRVTATGTRREATSAVGSRRKRSGRAMAVTPPTSPGRRVAPRGPPGPGPHTPVSALTWKGTPPVAPSAQSLSGFTIGRKPLDQPVTPVHLCVRATLRSDPLATVARCRPRSPHPADAGREILDQLEASSIAPFRWSERTGERPMDQRPGGTGGRLRGRLALAPDWREHLARA